MLEKIHREAVKLNFFMPRGDVYAPDFPPTAVWLNCARPLSRDDLKGRVVLLDFWTYCCINCLHLLPDIQYLEDKYRDYPFLVIGVHTAKFDNERNEENIEAAISRYHIRHPVVIDNERVIWEAYGIRAWPSLVLIDSQGRIRGTLEGENWRLLLDKAIEGLLAEGEREKTLTAPFPLSTLEIKPTLAALAYPGKIALDPAGRYLFVADTGHHRVLACRLKAFDRAQVIESFESFNQPQGLCLVGDFLYVCDTGNHLIKRIDLINKSVKTIAGTGEKAGFNEPKGEGLETALNSPWDLAYAEGYLYIAMAGAHQIWSLNLETNLVEVFAGSGLEGLADGDLFSAQLAQPSGISIAQNIIYFVDSEASALRKIDLRQDEVITLVGRGLFDYGDQDGQFAEAWLQHPLGVFAADQFVYLADTYNHALKRADLTSGQVKTLFGRFSESCRPDREAECEVLPLWEPSDVKLQGENLYLADTNNHLIRGYNLQSQNLFDVHLEDLPLVTEEDISKIPFWRQNR